MDCVTSTRSSFSQPRSSIKHHEQKWYLHCPLVFVVNKYVGRGGRHRQRIYKELLSNHLVPIIMLILGTTTDLYGPTLLLASTMLYCCYNTCEQHAKSFSFFLAGDRTKVYMKQRGRKEAAVLVYVYNLFPSRVMKNPLKNNNARYTLAACWQQSFKTKVGHARYSAQPKSFHI